MSSHASCRQAVEEASAQLRVAQQGEQGAAEKLGLQKSALSAMEADFAARTERLQAALQEAAAARSSVDALHAEASKASSEAQAALKVSNPSPCLTSDLPLQDWHCASNGVTVSQRAWMYINSRASEYREPLEHITTQQEHFMSVATGGMMVLQGLSSRC